MLRAVGFKEVLTTRLDGNAGKRKVSINRSVLCRVTNFQGRRERERKLLRLGASDQGRCWHLYRNDLLIIALCRGIKFILFFFFFLIKLFFLSIFFRIKIYSPIYPNITFTCSYIIIMLMWKKAWGPAIRAFISKWFINYRTLSRSKIYSILLFLFYFFQIKLNSSFRFSLESKFILQISRSRI